MVMYGDEPIRVSVQALGESPPGSKSNEICLDTDVGITTESAPGWDIRGPQMGVLPRQPACSQEIDGCLSKVS